MFVAKGKGSLAVALNSSSATIAYDLAHSRDGKVISTVYILDKVGRRLTVYDESNAVIFDGKFGIPFEPAITASSCEKSDKQF